MSYGLYLELSQIGPIESLPITSSFLEIIKGGFEAESLKTLSEDQELPYLLSEL